MTIFPKRCLRIKKLPLLNEKGCNEDVVRIQTMYPQHHQRGSVGALFCMLIGVVLLLCFGLVTVMEIYDQTQKDTAKNRYKGFCSIPLSRDIQELEQRKLSPRWKALENPINFEPDFQVISLMEEDPENLMSLLKEMLDINIDSGVERISVFNNGHPVSFIHDFASNTTGIIDSDRCFTMDLDPTLVLAPAQFAEALKQGDALDVSRVRSPLVATWPAELDTANHYKLFDKQCDNKPTYRLHKETGENGENGAVIRKRSVDAPPHDFIQFAGKSIQEIEITNLADILQNEQNVQQAKA